MVSGCSNNNTPVEVSATEFQKEYKNIGLGTMVTKKYLGQKNGRAYLKISRMSITNQRKWYHKTIYTKVSSLNADFKKKLQSLNQ